MENKIVSSFDGIDRDVRMVRGGRCWVKISKIGGRYHVAFGWKGECTAIPGRTVTTNTFRHAKIMAQGWIKDYGF